MTTGKRQKYGWVAGVAALCVMMVAAYGLLDEPRWGGYDVDVSGELDRQVFDISFPDHLPEEGDAAAPGVAPANTRITLYVDGSDDSPATFELRELSTINTDEAPRGKPHFFVLDIPMEAVRDGDGEVNGDFWLEVAHRSEDGLRHRHLLRHFHTETPREPAGDRLGSDFDDIDLFEHRRWPGYVNKAPALRPKHFEFAGRIGYVEEGTDGVDTIYLWPVQYGESGGEPELTVAALVMRKDGDDEGGSISIVRDVDFQVLSPQTALRAGPDGQWSKRASIQTNSHGLGTFELRSEGFEPFVIQVFEEGAQQTEAQNADFETLVQNRSDHGGVFVIRPPSYPAMVIDPPVVTADTEALSVRLPERKITGNFSNLELVDNPLVAPGGAMVLDVDYRNIATYVDNEAPMLERQFDVQYAGDGAGQLRMLNERARGQRTVTFVESTDDIITAEFFDGGDEADRRETAAALAQFWGLLVQMHESTDLQQREAGFQETAGPRIHRWMTELYPLGKQQRAAVDQRNHLTSPRGMAGFAMLIAVFLALIALNARMTRWQRLQNASGDAVSIPVLMKSFLASLGLFGLWILFGTRFLGVFHPSILRGILWLYIGLVGFVPLLLTYVSRVSASSDHTRWCWTQVGLAAAAGLAMHFARFYSGRLVTAVWAVIIAATLFSLVQLAVGFDDDRRMDVADEKSWSIPVALLAPVVALLLLI